jgi:hypothetical protein
MITLLIIIGMAIILCALHLVREGRRLGCLLYLAATVIFVITGIHFVQLDEVATAVFQFVAAFGALFGAIYGVFVMNDDED